jgi:hypothetical protein
MSSYIYKKSQVLAVGLASRGKRGTHASCPWFWFCRLLNIKPGDVFLLGLGFFYSYKKKS